MFPGPGAEIYRNEEGEVLGWDYPSDDDSHLYCDDCGYYHTGECRWWEWDDDDD